MTAPKKAKYHSPDGTKPIYDVLKENSDKTLDLGEDEVLVIGKCTVSEDGAVGTCTLLDKSDIAEAEKAEKAAKAEAEKAEKAEKAEAETAEKAEKEAESKAGGTKTYR